MTTVQIISRKSGYVLVEWTDTDGRLRRAWIKPDMVWESGPLPRVDRPERGVPYGMDFSRMITLSADSKTFDNALKRRGIWTIADLRTRPQEALGALHEAYGVDLAALLHAAKIHEEEYKE